ATMRQTHLAGDKLFVDWAGDRVSIIDQVTGEVHEASKFVAVLGASSYTYSEARWTETLPDWIGAHVNALHFLGGGVKAGGPRHSQGRHHQAVALRTGHQQDVSGARRSLRLCRTPDKDKKTSR